MKIVLLKCSGCGQLQLREAHYPRPEGYSCDGCKTVVPARLYDAYLLDAEKQLL